VPGQTINFTHDLYSSGATSPATINWTTQSTNGSGTVLSNLISGNEGTFTAGQTKTNVSGTESILVPLGTSPGTQYCRRLAFNPDTNNGGSNASAYKCATVVANYNLVPSISIQINGGSVAGNYAEPGDTVTFTYAVNNTTSGSSSGTSCTVYGLSRTGHYSPPSPADSTSDAGFTQPATGCPRNFAANTNTTLVTETVPASSIAANKSVCRSLYVNPSTYGGGAVGTEACVYVVAKPYFKSYGGDISAGGGLVTSPNAPTSCALNSGAAVIGWNKRSAGYPGAGVQYGILAMSTIFDTSSVTVNSSLQPHGLNFANNSINAPNGVFGGSFGTAPCVADYYSTKPASTSAVVSPLTITSLTSGNYSYTGNLILRTATVGAGQRITIYVDGNVIIDNGSAGNITYSGSWTVANMPLLRLIVRGNIYIDNDITELDGLYVAQKNGASGGTVYTCTTGGGVPQVPTNANFLTSCDTKLVVGGSLIASQIQLARTIGTLAQALSAETYNSNAAAEVFDYNPIMWIPQPTDATQPIPASYDAINSLPPVL
jgi:hypothetical protein